MANFYFEIIVFKYPEVYHLYEALQSKECISADRFLYKSRLKLFIITNNPCAGNMGTAHLIECAILISEGKLISKPVLHCGFRQFWKRYNVVN